MADDNPQDQHPTAPPDLRAVVQPHVDDDAVRDLADDVRYERALGVLADLTDRLMDTVKTMDDEAVRAPSLLPGWSRGHVLAHVARNADAMGNLLTWARTGVETPAYVSRDARDADIEEGARRSASELESDVEASGERLLARIADLPVARRHVLVRTGTSGIEAPAHDVLWWRIREVAYHHVDLDTGFRFAHLPDAVLVRGLSEAVDRVAAAGAPSLRLEATDLGWASDGGASGALAVRGGGGDLLGWLTGRTDGSGLTAEGPLPQLPAWG